MNGASWTRWTSRLCAVGTALPVMVGAQPDRRVADGVTCPTCRIEVNVVARLGASDGAGMLARPLSVSRDGRGRYWVLEQDQPPRVFHADGKFLAVVGRLGAGPGEFRSAVHAVPLPGDSMLVFDPLLRRAAVIGPDLTLARHVALPADLFPIAVLDWPSHTVANGTVRTPESIGWPLHRVSFVGAAATVVASFGPDAGDLRPDQYLELSQFVARDPRGYVWSADRFRYRLTGWTAAGRKQSTVVREADWFSGLSNPFSIGGLGSAPPPSPRLAGFDVDSSGLAWVHVLVAAPDWRAAYSRMPPSTGNAPRAIPGSLIDYHRLFTTRIEAVDLVGGKVIARAELPARLIAVLPGGRIAWWSEGVAGGQVTVATVRLRGMDVEMGNGR